ncbi:MAG TPA: glycoside hydrolase domain-containing protein [Verrucomicrobiae bacterium]
MKFRNIFFAFLALIMTNNIFAVSLGDRVAANGTVNVRPSPAGTPVSGQQSSGSLGVVIGGPQTATLSGTSYTWYDVNFDTGVDGWVANSGSSIGLTVVTPATPSSPSPGTSSTPGPTEASSTVTLSWGSSTGATYYDLGVVDVASGSFVVNTTTTSTSYTVTLTAGKTYKWNVAAADSAGDGTFTTVLYFQTPSVTVTPSITSVSPALPIGSNSQQPFTINGNNFVSGCTVTLRDLTANQTFANRTISSQTSSQIVINPDFTTAADNWSVEVINPGNASSGQYDFMVQAPTVTPSITSVLPNPATGSNSGQTLTINGSGFVSGAQVNLAWPTVGGIPAGNKTLSATFASSSQLQVTATLGNDPETWTAQVINPGNVTSSTFNFSEQAPFPVIQLLSPSSASVGGGTFTLTVSGNTFDQGSVVRWNGVNLTTTPSISAGGLVNYLTAQVPANDIASAGSATITVFNPTPGGGTSSGMNFNIGSSPANRQGVDYASNHPNLSALKAAGYSFVIRYVSASGNAKNITSSEAQSLQSAGLDIILVFESTANEMQNGYSAGVADANTAVTVATAAGAPQNFFCYFACDFDAQPSDQTAINAYLDGAASVLGVARVGFYGGYDPLKSVLDAGKAAKGWQTTAWSDGNVDSRISLYQYVYNQTSAGGSYDVDEGFGSDLGQWSVADTTPPTISITLPTSGSTYSTSSSTVSLSGTAGDNVGVVNVIWSDTQTAGAGSASGTTSWSVNNISLASGANTITVTAYDAAGNHSAATLTVTYTPTDTTPPTVSISSPTSGQTFTTSPVSVSGTATDPGSPSTGVSLVQVQVNGTSGTWQTVSGTTSWNASVPLSSGANTVYVRSQDGAGNYSTIASVNVTYNPPDTTPPTLSITSPLNGSTVTSASLPISGTATDNGNGNSGISSVTVNGIAANNDTATGSSTANWSATIALHSGQNTIAVIAKDMQNNPTSQQINVNYNPPRPVFGSLFVSGGQLQATVSGLSTQETIVFSVSTDLKNWTPIQTNVASGSTYLFSYTITPATKSQFFRATVQ